MGPSSRRGRSRHQPLDRLLNRPVQGTLAILLGAAFLAWPLALNGYPILFSDTGALLDMGLLPSMGWDKPFVYGPLATVLSLQRTLILPALAQAILLSYVLWATQSAFARPTIHRHLLLCLVLATATAAPWFAVTLLPDALTPVAALGILTAAGTLPRRHTLPIAVLTAVAIAAHLSHLVLAAALIAALILVTRRISWRPLASLAAALLFLLASNLVGHGRLAISPYGSVFALARLVADGPARTYLARTCPDPTLALCAWQSRLTDDSDQFLWDPAGPFWSDPLPLPEFAAQASRIVAGTLRTEPLPVLRDAYRNAAAEFLRTDLGDTLGPDFLADTIRPRLLRWFPPNDLARFDRSPQANGTLAPQADRLHALHEAVLALAILACAALLIAALRNGPNCRADLAALVLVALAANAFATGALSTPHDRYQTRLAWIVTLPFLLARPPSRRPLPPTPL